MLERIEQIGCDIQNFILLLKENKNQLNPDNPINKLIDNALFSLMEFENIISFTKHKVIYATKLQSSLLQTCNNPVPLSSPSNMNALKRLHEHSSNNLQTLVKDLDKIQEELQYFKVKMETFQEFQDI